MAARTSRSGAGFLPASEEDEAHARARRELGIGHLDAGQELIDDETYVRLNAVGTTEVELLLEEIAAEIPPDRPQELDRSRRVEPPRSPAEVARIESELLDATNRAQVADAALRLALSHARVAALLVVNRGMIAGLCGQGGDLENRIEGVVISCEVPSLFADPANRGYAHRGGVPSGGVDAQILRAMGRDAAREIAILPISIGKRVVNLLYVDNGDDAIGETSLAALRMLCELVAGTYEGLILARRGPAAGADSP